MPTTIAFTTASREQKLVTSGTLKGWQLRDRGRSRRAESGRTRSLRIRHTAALETFPTAQDGSSCGYGFWLGHQLLRFSQSELY